MEKREESVCELVPIEIKALLLTECFGNSVYDTTSLMHTNKSFYEARKRIVWKDAYYKAYEKSDEFNIDKPSHGIKLFLRNFLPEDPNAGNSEWHLATIFRTKYDTALWRLNENKTLCKSRSNFHSDGAKINSGQYLLIRNRVLYSYKLFISYYSVERSGWQTVERGQNDPRLFKYKQNFDLNSMYTYGFIYTNTARNKLEDIENKFHLCFLDLTLQRFMQDPTDYPISAIDFYHFTKRVNLHLMYSHILCSKPLPPARSDTTFVPTRFNNFNLAEPIFLDGDNLEITIQPGREWGVYTNYARQGLFWGKELDELMKNKYKVDVSLYDQNLFTPNPNFRNFSDLIQ